MAYPTNTQYETHREELPRRPIERETSEVILAGSATEAIAGAGAVVLSILGLLGVAPTIMAAIATIAVGAALIIEGGSIAARLSRFSNGRQKAVGSGITTETFGGVAGVTLGILALVGIAPFTLMPIAAIVMGAAILIGAGATQQVEQAIHERGYGGEAMHQVVDTSIGARVLVGLGVATLGVLVLVGVGAPVSLTLIAMLALGAAELLFGSALGARVANVMR